MHYPETDPEDYPMPWDLRDDEVICARCNLAHYRPLGGCPDPDCQETVQ